MSLPRAIAMAEELCAYELQRLENIARNKTVLADLGLERVIPLTDETKPKTKRKREKAPVAAEPKRRRPRRGEEMYEEVFAVMPDAAEIAAQAAAEATAHLKPLGRAPKDPRLTAAQSAMLESLCPSGPEALQEEEVAAIGRIQEAILGGASYGGVSKKEVRHRPGEALTGAKARPYCTTRKSSSGPSRHSDPRPPWHTGAGEQGLHPPQSARNAQG